MNPLIAQFFAAAQESMDALNTALDHNAAALTPELGEELREGFQFFLNQRKIVAAQNAAIIASFVYLRLGMRPEGLRAHYDLLQIDFMLAETTEAYDDIRQRAIQIVTMADQIADSALAFEASVMAADSAYFASTVSARESQQWVLTAWQDLVIVSEQAKQAAVSEVVLQRFVSLLCAVIVEVTSLYWSDDELREVSRLGQQVAANTEPILGETDLFDDVPAKSHSVAQTLATLWYRFGDPDIATACLEQAMLRAEAENDIETWMQTVFLHYVGTHDAGASEAELTDRRALLYSRAEDFRRQFRSRAGRLWAAQELDRFCGEMLRDALREGDITGTNLFETIDGLKARLLLDQMSAALPDVTEQLHEMERQMLRFAPPSPDFQGLLSREMQLVSQLSIGTQWDSGERREALDQLEKLYAQADTGFLGGAQPASLAQVMQALQPKEALIEYFVPYHPLHPAIEIWMLVITSEQARLIAAPKLEAEGQGMIGRMSIDGRQPVDIDPLGGQVVTIRKAIQEGDDETARAGLEVLRKILIDPLEAQGFRPQDFQHWVVVPHGMLHYVPFAAIMTEKGQYLIEEVAVTIAPSISVWHRLQGRQNAPVSSFLGLANPLLGYTQMPPLESAAKEVAQISKRLSSLQCLTFQREEATETALRTSLSGKNIVHLATHGEFPEESVIDFHNILLAATTEHDGRLHAEELSRMDLHSVRLLALSICNGGLYRFGPGDEPYGLIAASLTAGAENVLSTIWPIEDAIGRFFTTDYYKHLLAHGPAEALRRTCQQFIEDEALLRHWAGFVLVGSGQAWS